MKGLIHSDLRGQVRFNNEASLTEFKRFYIIENSRELPMRGWHGHKFETKGFVCLEGSVRIGGVEILDWSKPEKSTQVFSADLFAGDLDFFYLPSGFANAILSLSPVSRVMVFSSSTLQESQADDYRFPAETWDLTR
jgi:dTDP-4-dehydrorhamnose 3,5-epimerase